jgi:hypothetical protein
MPLTDYELDCLTEVVAVCDGEAFDTFERVALPRMATLSAGELLALAGLFVHHEMVELAQFIGKYNAAVWRARWVKHPRPDPAEFWHHGESKQVAQAFAKRQEAERSRWAESEELPF